MGEAISAILPQALGAAISPVAIIAVILMLFTPKAKVNAPVFAIGWLLGFLVVAGITYLVGNSLDVATDEDVKNWPYFVKIALGVLLFMLALKQWRGRPRPDSPPKAPPKWMQSIDQFTPGKAFGLGALLAGPNPKNLLFSIAVGTTLAHLGASSTDAWVAIFVYALLALIPVGGPVLYFFAAGEKAVKNLNNLKAWLGANNAIVMTVLFVIFSITLLSDGLQGLFAS